MLEQTKGGRGGRVYQENGCLEELLVSSNEPLALPPPLLRGEREMLEQTKRGGGGRVYQENGCLEELLVSSNELLAHHLPLLGRKKERW